MPASQPTVLRCLMLLTALVVFPTTTCLADVQLAPIFGDGMVLQHDTDVVIWGWASPGETVRVESSWVSAAHATADASRRWQVSLPTPVADGKSHSLTVTGQTTVTIDDILLGEVWICSGQSNMEMPVANRGGGYRGVANSEEEIAAANFPKIRFFTVRNTLSAQPRTDCRGEWLTCDPASVAEFSAVGYFFGRDLHRELDVPVGVISADWGGTRVEAWMSEAGLRPFDGYDTTLDYVTAVRDPNRRRELLKDQMGDWWGRLDTAPLRKWAASDFDDSAWKTTTLPRAWDGDLTTFDGIAYFRRTIDIPAGAETAAAVLSLGPIDDNDDVAINGVTVGFEHGVGAWSKPRRYTIDPGVLRPGKNVIAIRVLDNSGPGGVFGQPEQLRLELEGHDPISVAGEWRYLKGRKVANLPSREPQSGLSKNTPTVLYNGMIHPIQPFTMRGVIWYQGESNRGNAAQYRTVFPGMINNWRSIWDQGDFPFYFVQIAPYAYGNDKGQTAELREAQHAALALPHTGMAVTLDIGNPKDIHPNNKQDVGSRLAKIALTDTYGRAGSGCGPTFQRAETTGTAIRVHFAHASSGLELREGSAGIFEIAGADGTYHPATAKIAGAAVTLSSVDVAKPVTARYGWSAAPKATLFNKDGLPAAPFRTDALDVRSIEKPNVKQYRSSDPEFRPLFNGRDLEGWHNVNCAPSTWRADGDTIVCSGIPTGVLRTDRHYQNFVLELEWRHLAAGGNAGIFVWSDPITAKGQPFTRSVEVQVLDGREGTGFTSDGDIFPIHGSTMTPVNGRGGSRAFPTEKRSRPSPEWNHYRIECVDGRISLALNGKVVTQGTDCNPMRGYICLESEGSPVEFRHARIKELPSTGSLASSSVAHLDTGFKSLYTGVDFTGWQVTPDHRNHWSAADWRMTFDGKGPDLWTEKSYRDFTLICDWRWTGKPEERARPVILPDGSQAKNADGSLRTELVADAGDSGIYLRGGSKSQVNIWCWPIGSGEVYGYRTDTRQSAEVRAGVTPQTRADAPIGEWNRFEITVRGDRLTVDLNGTRVLDNAQLPGIPKTGPIGLQQHGSAIEFANIYVKELERTQRF